MRIKCFYFLFFSNCLLFFIINPARAGEIYFQPRVTAGLMQYEFEGEAISRVVGTGFNATVSAFKHEDVMPFVSGGMTFFLDRLFLDLSGQYAFDGDNTSTLSRSAFQLYDADMENMNISSYYATFSSQSVAAFDRTDRAISMGYELTTNFSLFLGYKWSETAFFEKFSGTHTMTLHENIDSNPTDAYGGRLEGSATYKFQYSGPFLGCAQGFDFSKSRFVKGVLSANVALALLEGKLEVLGSAANRTIQWVNDETVDEYQWKSDKSNISSRMENTKGDALGLKVGLTWRGLTPWEGLSYLVGVSAYRYEFDSDEDTSDMNETATSLKIGLTYLF